MAAAPSPEFTGQLLPGPTVDQVLRLQAIRAYPSISLLLTTRAANRMIPSDAIAVLVGPGHTETVPLPVTVRNRAVVDHTFATRDLVRSLHRTPRHVVLVLNSGQARLFDGGAGVLHPATTDSFPMFPPERAGGNAVNTAFLRRVDTAFGVYLRLRLAPLILIGPDKVLTACKALSRNTGRLAGTIGGNLARVPLRSLS